MLTNREVFVEIPGVQRSWANRLKTISGLVTIFLISMFALILCHCSLFEERISWFSYWHKSLWKPNERGTERSRVIKFPLSSQTHLLYAHLEMIPWVEYSESNSCWTHGPQFRVSSSFLWGTGPHLPLTPHKERWLLSSCDIHSPFPLILTLKTETYFYMVVTEDLK